MRGKGSYLYFWFYDLLVEVRIFVFLFGRRIGIEFVRYALYNIRDFNKFYLLFDFKETFLLYS